LNKSVSFDRERIVLRNCNRAAASITRARLFAPGTAAQQEWGPLGDAILT